MAELGVVLVGANSLKGNKSSWCLYDVLDGRFLFKKGSPMKWKRVKRLEPKEVCKIEQPGIALANGGKGILRTISFWKSESLFSRYAGIMSANWNICRTHMRYYTPKHSY
jgi:hypothetical protein